VRSKLLVALAVLIVAVAACVGCNDKQLQYVRMTLGGQDVLGVSRSGVTVQGIVLFFHGMDRDQSVLDFDDAHRELTATLADAGYAVVAGSAGGNVWGNAASQQMYLDLAVGAAEHYRVDKFYFLAESMGTIAAMNLFAHNKVANVAGMVGINPLLNLGSMPPKYYQQAQDANAGVPIPEVNPLDLPAASMAGKNLRFYVTPDDQLVPTPQNANVFEKKFGGAANISTVKCTGEHMDASCIQGKDIVEWYSSLDPR
jgi:pimeloyl-ACP methyl ester carboxylesterase